MQVGGQRSVEVHLQPVGVVPVEEQHERIGRPAAGEREEDDEHHPGLAQRRRQRPPQRVATVQVQPFLGGPDVDEDLQVEGGDDQKGHQDATRDEEHRVRVGERPVPEALVRLPVEAVPTPADVTRQVEQDAGQPRAETNQRAAPPGERAPVGGVVADVDVAVDADAADAEQRTDAAADAEVGQRLAEPRLVGVEVLASDDACNQNPRMYEIGYRLVAAPVG